MRFSESRAEAPPRERYQRPHCYNLGIGTAFVRLAQQRTPVLSFLVQNDINNTGIINVGDSHVSLVNGVQLDPGRAWVFSVNNDGLLATSLSSTPINWADAMNGYGAQGANFDPGITLYIDVADFFAISDTAAPLQNLRVFWSTTTQ